MTAPSGVPILEPSPSASFTPPAKRSGDAHREPWMGHVVPLDGLRGVAILLVLLLHFTTDMPFPAGSVAGGVRWVFQRGWIGVDLFFVLSGFLITGILVDNAGSGSYFRVFYARRALRILPLYFLTVLFAFHLLPRLFQNLDTGGARTELAFWFFLANFVELPHELWRTIGHLWSLAIEEQFYLLWPLVVFLTTRRQARSIALAVVILSPLLRWLALQADVSPGSVYRFTPFRVDGLAMGAFIALSVRDERDRARLARLTTFAGPIAALVALVLFGPVPIPAPYSLRLDLSIGFSALSVAFGALLTRVLLAAPRAPLSRILSWPALVTLGTHSYAMYLLHIPLLRVVSKVALPPDWPGGMRWPLTWMLGYTLVLGALTFGAAFVTWHLVESRFLALKRHFRYARA